MGNNARYGLHDVRLEAHPVPLGRQGGRHTTALRPVTDQCGVLGAWPGMVDKPRSPRLSRGVWEPPDDGPVDPGLCVLL